MTNEEAVAIVCAVGRKIESDLLEAEVKHAADTETREEAEVEIRKWVFKAQPRTRAEEIGLFGSSNLPDVPEIRGDGPNTLRESGRMFQNGDER